MPLEKVNNSLCYDKVLSDETFSLNTILTTHVLECPDFRMAL